MIMLIHKHLFWILIVFFSLYADAYEPKEGSITTLIGPFAYRTIFPDNTAGASSKIQGDGAIIINGDINSKGSLEIAIMHMRKMYFRDDGKNSIVEASQLMHIGMGYRRWISSYFSVAAAFYSAYPLDEAQIIHSDFLPGNEIATSAHDKTEYGIDISLQHQLWGTEKMSVILDARYGLSITNLSREKGDHYGLILGIKFLIQEKKFEN